jgi:small subunit ribosomal protein S16
MPVKMRLQRFGKKGQPIYHIVVADSKAPRDGRFVEKLGTYNPLPNPAEVLLDIDRSVYWLNCGAQPTDTVRAILSYKGVLLKKHLLKGIEKGALTAEQAEAKFQAWQADKSVRIQAKVNSGKLEKKNAEKERLEAERKVAEERAARIAKKRSAELAAEAASVAEPDEIPVVEAENTEAPAAE